MLGKRIPTEPADPASLAGTAGAPDRAARARFGYSIERRAASDRACIVIFFFMVSAENGLRR
jgi:hypothetical protein